MMCVHCDQALTGSDFQLRVGSGRVNLKVGLSGTLGSGSDKFLRLIGPVKNVKSMAWGVGTSYIEYILP